MRQARRRMQRKPESRAVRICVIVLGERSACSGFPTVRQRQRPQGAHSLRNRRLEAPHNEGRLERKGATPFDCVASRGRQPMIAGIDFPMP